jgi:ribonucleoside-diphosphate reductase alpha chain
MFSEPITSLSATSKAAPFHAILTDGLSSQKTIRVKKRDGPAERVDIAKIVQAINHCCTGLSDIEPSHELN